MLRHLYHALRLRPSLVSTAWLWMAGLLFGTLTMQATIVTPSEVEEAKALLSRVAPQIADRFDLSLISADEGRDVFEYEASTTGRVVLRGNSAGSLAFAFNQYLRREQGIDFDWLADKPLSIAAISIPAAKVRGACAARERFFLNYCTYGYTFPWWRWDQWERFIDWMAMNGINRPLLQAGHEAIWENVWRALGLTDEELGTYFSGPAHLPWNRMANLDAWGGPLPQGYIEGQMLLQRRILTRARGLGMKPILSAFSGHVPKALRRVYPKAMISLIKPGWSGMAPEFGTAFLDPHDPLFAEIQRRFLVEQERLYGTDHLYATDPFNEINPPDWDPDYLAGVSRSIYQGMASQDPEAVWYQMTWTFSFFKLDHQWTKERLVKMFGAVPRGRMVLLDYAGEEQEFYPGTENCYGLPFIWNYLGNFGGNSHLEAPLDKVSRLSSKALSVPNCAGVGSTLEGLGTNPVVYEMVLETPWLGGQTTGEWVKSYAKRRCVGADPSVLAAWELLGSKVLIDNPRRSGSYGSVFQGLPPVPGYKGRTQNSFTAYSLADLSAAVALLLKAGPETRRLDAYQYDVVNFTRQALCDLGRDCAVRMDAAFRAHDLPSFEKESSTFMAIGADLDRLVGTRREFLLGRWLDDARSWGRDPSEASYFEFNAREILTSWHEAGGELTDYASRQWNGLIRDYYLPRWERYVDLATASLRQNAPFPSAEYLKAVTSECRTWKSLKGNGYPINPTGDPVEVAREVFEKYFH